MRYLPNGQQVYTDNTMKSWTKEELVKYVRMCERNITDLAERVENQAKLLKENTHDNSASVVHAYWKDRTGQDPYCSNCGFSYEHEQGESAQITDYCGNCGAKMDEEENDNV